MASPALQQQAPQIVDVPLSLFGGMHTGVAPADLPEGLSPDNQDWSYVPGEGFSRPGLSAIFSTPFGAVAAVYSKTYVQENGNPLTLAMDATGKIYVEDVANNPGEYTTLTQINPGVSAFSCSAFGREYIALSDLLQGQWCPLQYNGETLERVTQDGPGAGPSCANSQPPVASIGNTGSGTTYNVTGYVSNPFIVNGKIIYYQSLTLITPTPNGLVEGETIGAAAFVFASGGYGYYAFPQVETVINATTFTIAGYYPFYTTLTSGTITVEQPSLVRTNNIVTGTTTTPHGFKVGWQVQISGIQPTDIGGGIASISRDGNGNVTVVTVNPHGLPIGANVAIAGTVLVVDDTVGESFNVASVPVQSVPSPTSFTYAQGGLADTATANTGNVQDIWAVTAFIQSIPSPTSFAFQNIGPNNITNADGTATIIGQISPGAHGVVVIYLTDQGALTKPSPPITFYANGAQQMVVNNIPIGPSNVVARILGFTGAGGDNYFVIPAIPQVGTQIVGTSCIIADNTSTSALIDFADNTLFDGIAIDQIGNDLFDQRTLAAPIGFFSYASRLSCWGDFNKIENLLNMTLAAGTQPTTQTNLAGSGANSGGGTAWTNPGNVGLSASYANANLGAGATSQNLLSENFGFAAAIPLGITHSFNYYWTGGKTLTENGVFPSITAQLLKAGVPIGAPQTVLLVPTLAGQGTAALPLTASLIFPVTGLAPADIANAAFGVQFSASAGTYAADIFINNDGLAIYEVPTTPIGWSSTGSTSLTGLVVDSSLPGMYQQYQMTSAGGTNDCMISQSAYEDTFGDFILSPLTNYLFRLFVSCGAIANGNLFCDLYSPTLGLLASATVDVSTAGSLRGFFFADFSAETPAVIPSDTLVRIYLQGVTAGAVVTIGEQALIFQQQPQANAISFWSYPLNPEGFAQTTGLLGSADDPSDVKSFSIQRNSALLKTYAGLHTFQDNDSEPDQWVVNNLSRSVGCCSIRGGDPGQFGTGDAAEDWDLTVNQNGVYLTAGAQFWKISQELQKGDPNTSLPTWDAINWAYEHTIWTKNDPKNHRAYIGVPMFKATVPNLIFVLDYRELDTASDLAAAPSLKIGITGKMLSTDKSRKWTRWNIPANCADIIVRPGNDKEITFAGGTNSAGNAFGNLYTLDPAKLTDDDYGQIFPYYTTYGFVNHEQEQMLGLGTDRKLTRKLCLFATGVGYVTITPLIDSLQNPLPATIPQLLSLDSDPSNLQGEDLEWTAMIRGERVFYQFQVQPFPGSTDVQLKLQKFIAHMMKDPVIIHRSSAI